MTIEQIRKAYQAKPFQPFTIHLADGRAFPVPSPEFNLAIPTSRTFVVYHEDAFDILHLLLVTSLEFKINANGGGKRRR
jgi:hypothetical protein